MLWLDSNYPLDRDPSEPGVARGTCPTTSGVPKDVEAQNPDSTVVYSNIKWGPVGSTFAEGSAKSAPPPTNAPGSATGTGTGSTPTTPINTTPVNTQPTGAPAANQTHYGQCGGNGWT